MGLASSPAIRHAKGLQGYAHRTQVLDDGAVVAQVWHGGCHAYPHAVFTSDDAPAGAALLRQVFPGHTVTRLDAKEDFAEPDAFDRLQVLLLDAARRHRVKVDTRGDHLLRKEARTIYLGAKSSAVQCRQYDKAAELRSAFAHDAQRLELVPPHLTRLEVQVRPSTTLAKQAFATIGPLQAMGSSEWMRDIWQGISGEQLEPVQVTKPWRASDDERAYRYMVGAFGAMLAKRMQDHGSWAALGAQLGHDIEQQVQADRRLKGGR